MMKQRVYIAVIAVLVATNIFSLYKLKDKNDYTNNVIKPYVREQNIALDKYIVALGNANARLYEKQDYVLDAIKQATGDDASLRQNGLLQLLSFQSADLVKPPDVPDKIEL